MNSQALMATDPLLADVEAASRIAAIPTILGIVCKVTGMRFAAVARVTEERWIACGIRDDIAFGMKTGDELRIETTFCRDVRAGCKPVVMDHVAEDPTYRSHPTPALYGFQSYLSVPIQLPDGTFFGTLCALDPRPVQVNTPSTIGMFRMFADLIAFHLDARQRVDSSEATLLSERESAELREQLIAVLGHDLRNPLSSITTAGAVLMRTPLNTEAQSVVAMMQRSAKRMAALIDDVLDFARGRLGSGVTVQRSAGTALAPVLTQVVDELRAVAPSRTIELHIDLAGPVECDTARVGQLLSNLVANALMHGAPAVPVIVRATADAQWFELSVANGGDPIPPELLARLFHPFARAAARSSEQGLGLGLYIANEIARAHGGTLVAKSTPAETRFTFRMPVR